MAFWTRFIKRKSPLLEAQEPRPGLLKRIGAFLVRQKAFWYATGLSLIIIVGATYYAVYIRPFQDVGKQAGMVVDQPAVEVLPEARLAPGEAEEFPNIRESVTESRDEALALMKQAEIHYQQGQLDVARDQLQKSISLTSDSSLLTIAYANLANILEGEGRYARAVQILQRALTFDRHFVQGYHNLGVVHLKIHEYDNAQVAFEICVREKPDFAPCHAGLGEVHTTLGRLTEAIAAYTESLKIQDDPGTRLNLGLAYLQSGNKGLAIEQFTAILKASPENYLRYLALFNRAYAYDKIDRHAEAVEDYRAAVALAPKDVDATFNLGLSLMAIERKEESLASFRHVIELDPLNFDAYANAVTLHSDLGQFQAALDLLKPVQDKLPDHKRVNYLMGHLYHRVGRLAESHDAFFRVLYTDPTGLTGTLQADALAALASVMDDSGDLPAAERLYLEAIQIDKNASYLHYNLARTYRRHRKLEEAVKEITIASEMEQSSNYTYVLAMAEILLEAEILNKSFDAYKLAAELLPDETYPRFMMAHTAARQQLWTTALAEFNRLLTKNPEPEVKGAIYKGIGNVYHEEGEFEQALAAYKEALPFLPNDAALYYNVGRTYFQMGKLDECHAALQKSIALHSESSEAYTLLGSYFFKKGLMDRAFASFDRAVKINPENIEAYYNREALKKYQ